MSKKSEEKIVHLPIRTFGSISTIDFLPGHFLLTFVDHLRLLKVSEAFSSFILPCPVKFLVLKLSDQNQLSPKNGMFWQFLHKNSNFLMANIYKTQSKYIFSESLS